MTLEEYLAGVFDAKSRFFEKRGKFKITLNLRDADFLYWYYEKVSTGNFIKNKRTCAIVWNNDQICELQSLVPFLRLKDQKLKNVIDFLNADFDIFTRRAILHDVRRTLHSDIKFSSSPPFSYVAGFFDVCMSIAFVKYKPRINVIYSKKHVLEKFREILQAGSVYRLSKTFNLTFYHEVEVFNLVQILYPEIHCKKEYFSILYDLFADLISVDDARAAIRRLNRHSTV